jgi:ubiquinone/menaquinone biosynthesis C-methylase UbiE
VQSNSPAPKRPDYGLDAPDVVRNLFLAGAAGWAIWASVMLGLWSGAVLGAQLWPMAFGCAVGFTLTGLWMVWDSKVGKYRRRERLLDRLAWRGDESVLDVGCGRGLMLTAAARRVPRGKAVGVDLWQAEDLTGNRPEATLENARLEGVADRVEVHTADMRKMPFPDGTFDVIVSNVAIHNLYQPAEREQAVAEIARVLKPGGQVLINDIRHGDEYAAAFVKHGCADVRRLEARWLALMAALFTFGSLRPATLLARKPSATSAASI